MTPPIRMVSVPVEPTEAMWKAASEVWEGHERPYTFDCTKAAFRAMLAAAPVREGGAVDAAWRQSFIADEEEGPVSGVVIDLPDGSQIWTGDCSNTLLDSMGDERPDESGQFLTVAIKGRPTRVVASVANTEDGIALARALAAALATREEAPAEAGEQWLWRIPGRGWVLCDREDDVVREARVNDAWVETEVVALSARLAQPQAREEAQPVAKVVSAHGDPEAFGEREIEVLTDLRCIPYNTPLYTTPPAPEAEKLRVAVEALTLIADVKTAAPVSTARQALAALQQDAAAPGEAGE
nr:hypothetical protein [Enterobacter roggenkampii]